MGISATFEMSNQDRIIPLGARVSGVPTCGSRIGAAETGGQTAGQQVEPPKDRFNSRPHWRGNGVECKEYARRKQLLRRAFRSQHDWTLEGGVWFQVIQGIQGVVVIDEHEKPHVYMLTKQASHYFSIITKCDRMPVLIEQEI